MSPADERKRVGDAPPGEDRVGWVGGRLPPTRTSPEQAPPDWVGGWQKPEARLHHLVHLNPVNKESKERMLSQAVTHYAPPMLD